MANKEPAWKSMSANQPASPTRKMSGGVLAAILVGIVALVGIVTFVATSGGDADDSASDTTTAPAVEWRPIVTEGADLPPYVAGSADTAVGTTAPVIHGATFYAEPTDIAPGKATLVVVLAHWCPHCQAEVPRLVEWSKSGNVPAGLDIIGLATSTDETAPNFPPSKWLANEDFPWTVIADTEEATGAKALGASGFPFFAMLDAEGKVLWRTSGEVAISELQERIDSALPAA